MAHVVGTEERRGARGLEAECFGEVVLDLRPGLPGPLGRLEDDALSALISLGYKAADVKDAITRASQVRPEPMPLTELIREVLKDLARG